MTVLDKVKAFFKRPKPEVKGAETKGVRDEVIYLASGRKGF